MSGDGELSGPATTETEEGVERLTVREVVQEFLLSQGVNTVFGNPGSTEMRFFRDWPEAFDYVVAPQESSVLAMADGYAQASGTVGFAMVHSAAGLGHALGSLYTANRNHTALLVVAGQQTRSILPFDPYLHARDAAEFPRPYVKFSVEPASAQEVPVAIIQAYRAARREPRGPVFVSVPEDDWDTPAGLSLDEILHDVERAEQQQGAVDLQALNVIVAAFQAHRAAGGRTALVLGAGVVGTVDARRTALALAVEQDLDVFTAPLSGRAVFPEDHPRFAGFLPPVAAGIRSALTGYGLVLVAGAPAFTLHVPSDGPPVGPGTRVFHLTADPGEAGSAMVGEALVGPVAELLAELLASCRTAPMPGVASVQPLAAAGRVPAPSESMSPEYVLHVVSELLPQDVIVVEEAPTHRNAMHRYLPIRGGQDFYVAASGGLGWAMPAAVGIALAAPDRPVVCLMGDGSSLYSIQALWTAAQRKAGIVFVVLNNGGYAAMKAFGSRLGVQEAPGLNLPGVRLSSLAEGFGARAAALDTTAELQATLRQAFEADQPWTGPLVLDVKVGPADDDLY